MSHFAVAVVRDAKSWTATELDLGGAADIEDVADRLRDVHSEAEISLLFVECDDMYLAVLRLDEGEDLRVFGSDSGFVDESRLGALLLGDAKEPVTLDLEVSLAGDIDGGTADAADGDGGPESQLAADADPVGDPDLLSDLGVPAPRLLVLCGREGMLPADVTAELCQLLGCGDEVEELRET